MSIISLEAAIAYMKTDADLSDLVGDRIADKHRFGHGWTPPCKAIQVRYDGGGAQIYLPVQEQRLEIRCYGETRYQAARVHAALQTLCRNTGRTVIETTQGRALIQWLNLVSSPSVLYDDEAGVDSILVFAEVSVAEEDVT